MGVGGDLGMRLTKATTGKFFREFTETLGTSGFSSEWE